jgi:hypothetical protein
MFRRHDTRAFGDQLRFERARWRNSVFVAKQLRTALENPGLAGDPDAVITRGEAAVEFRRLHPQAARMLGEAVVAAAIPDRSACRWCMAAAYGRVHRVPVPNPRNLGAQFLLGPPCRHAQRMGPVERRAVMAELSRRVEPSRLEARRRLLAETVERQRRLVASGAKPGFVVGDPASWRRWARMDLTSRAPWVLDRRQGRRR